MEKAVVPSGALSTKLERIVRFLPAASAAGKNAPELWLSSLNRVVRKLQFPQAMHGGHAWLGQVPLEKTWATTDRVGEQVQYTLRQQMLFLLNVTEKICRRVKSTPRRVEPAIPISNMKNVSQVIKRTLVGRASDCRGCEARHGAP
ncbi:MAG: hypothetical protein LBC27_03550 [Spirochaetaceae bacterium]|nr:hypothetical protein [Spirochaetaceae bacterium]